MTQILLVRHGETEDNTDKRITGQQDPPLNQNGVRQAEKTAARLADHSIDAAYTSDLQRTAETTERIARRHGITPEHDQRLRERDFGRLEGRPKTRWRDRVQRSGADPLHLTPDGGESLHDAGTRIVTRLDTYRDRYPEAQLLVGSHGVAIKAAILHLLDLPGTAYARLSVHNASITELTYDRKQGWILVRINDTGHL